jgi:hypothetical protein
MTYLDKRIRLVKYHALRPTQIVTDHRVMKPFLRDCREALVISGSYGMGDILAPAC